MTAMTYIKSARFGDPLNERDLRVLAGISRGDTDAKLGRAMGIGEPTVKAHVARLLRKLGGRNRAHAVALAAQSDLLPELVRPYVEVVAS